MALSSWAALYTHIEQKFMRMRQYKQLNLLRVMCQHADCFGLSYPGDDLIQDLTAIGTIAQLNEHLQFLVDGEYIKIWETWNHRRKKYDRDFQVSPLAMYIREEYQAYCEHIWMTGERDYELENEIVIKLKGQPSTETESVNRISKPESVTNTTTQQSTASKKTKQRALGGDDYETDEQKQLQRQRRKKTGIGRSTEKNPQAGGPPPPEKIDLRKYQSPLPPDDEDRAQDMVVMFRMRISQARGLVANYGRDQVETAARVVADGMEQGTCTNPAGLLTYLLKRGGSSPDDRKLYPSPAEKMAAENAKMTYQDNQFSDQSEV